MLKKLILLISVCSPLLMQAQVTVSVQLPSAGMVQKEQLWNLVVVNNSNELLDATITLDLKNAGTGQTILTAGTRNFLLGKGVKMLNYRDIQPVQYNHMAADFSNSYIPLGAYVVCYRVVKNGLKGPEPLADECVRLNIEPLSPPLLNTPLDRSEIPVPYPQFTWIPPTPFDMFSNLNYDLIVSEVMEGQSGAEAIQYNSPVYTRNNLTQPHESYPTSYAALQPGKIYAWQIVARNGLSFAAKTEVWVFSIAKQDQPSTETEMLSYSLLQNDVTGTYYVRTDKLRIKYFSYDPAYETRIVFTDQKGNILKETTQKVRQGDNYFDLELGKSFQAGTVYKVTITDPAKKNHTLTFSINQN
jgi:hypothetical protein